MDIPCNSTGATPVGYTTANSSHLEHAQLITDIQFPDVTTITTVITITYVIVFLFGVIGNVLVIFVICKNPDMSTTTNYFLINLSLADLLVLLVCMPIGLTDLYAKDVWLLGSFMCKFSAFLEITVTNASIMTILAISFERYYAICRPLEVLYTCTKSRAVKILAGVWSFSAVSAAPFFAISYTELSVFHDQSVKLVCRSLINCTWKHVYNWAIFGVFFLLPSVMLTVLYTRICRELLRSESELGPCRTGSSAPTTTATSEQRFRYSCTNGAPALASGPATTRANCRVGHFAVNRTRAMRSRRQVIYMLIAVIVFSFCCLLPFRILTLWIIYSSRMAKARLGMGALLSLMHVSRILFYTNSAGNPILYNMMSTKFREASKRSVRMICRSASYDSGSYAARSGIERSWHVSCKRDDWSTRAEVFDYESTSPLTATLRSHDVTE